MTTFEKWYTTDEIKQLMAQFNNGSPINKQRVSTLGKSWTSSKVGTSKVYAKEDVDQYILTRRRTEMMRGIGQKFTGNWDEDEFDTTCPTCGAQAITNPDDPDSWLCWNGHNQGLEQKDTAAVES